MRILYCWRTRCDMPMLEEHEWHYIWETWRSHDKDSERTFAALSLESEHRNGRRLTPAPEDISPLARTQWFVCAGYELFTGSQIDHPNFVRDLRVALYGPPCAHCGKPLRTSSARFCAECGIPTLAAHDTA